jgi:hypothetical protein
MHHAVVRLALVEAGPHQPNHLRLAMNQLALGVVAAHQHADLALILLVQRSAAHHGIQKFNRNPAAP